LKEKIEPSVVVCEDPHSYFIPYLYTHMRKEFIYSALTGLAVAGSIGLTSFAATSNPEIPHMILSSQAPQVQAVNTKTSTPEKEVADAQENAKEVADTPDTGVSDEGKTETQDDTIALPTGALPEATVTKIALTANPDTTVTGFETEDEDGVALYNVSLSNGTDVKIDPVKGTILKTEKAENDANEANDTEGPDTENDPNDRDQDGK
jgi:Peptidase propeptide and YPEB domain